MKRSLDGRFGKLFPIRGAYILRKAETVCIKSNFASKFTQIVSQRTK